ncbi:C4-dicarboxylate ABC transporter substrate-binding protein [Rhodobacteraceae bacterium Araon29]
MRNLFRKVAAVSTAFALISGAAVAADVDGPELIWNVSLWGKPRAFTAGAEELAALVSEKTDGNWEIKLHYGGALSKGRENLDGIAIDAFEAAMMCNFYHPKKNPALMSLTMPFLPMADWDDNRVIRETVYQNPAVVGELANWNAMIYVSSYLPQYEVMGRGTPPATLNDWKGLTVRAGGGIGRAMKVIGATPTTSTATEVYTGIQQGTMDAASFPFTYSHVAYKLHEVSDWYTSNLSPGTSDCPMVFSINAHDALPDQYKQLLVDVREDVIAAQIQSYIDIDVVNIPLLKETLTEVIYSEEELISFRAAAGKPVIEEWIAENQGDFDARGLIESIFAAVGQTY